MSAFITATGSYLPDNVVTNETLAERLGLSPDQVFKSSGIRERRWANRGQTTSSLAAAAFHNTGTASEEIDYLLFGSMTPDRFIPGSAPSLQSLTAMREIPCLDIRAACCNTLYGLQLAQALVKTSVAEKVALCLAEVQSVFLNLTPAAGTVSMLFGDGAAALTVSSKGEVGALEIVDVHLATDGKYVDDLGIRSPGSEFGTFGESQNFEPRMNGQSVILQASRKMASACQQVLQRNSLTVDDVSWVVPHQANANLLAQVARGIGLKDARKVVSVIEHTGNTSSASMGIALDQLMRSGELRSGDWILMPAFAAGFTWGAGLLRVSR
ncbi:MAG TPA: ketoacyl-ACP synthase III [Pyrinomonadaceae bacterium]